MGKRSWVGYESPCRARAAEPELPSQKFNFVFFSEQWRMNINEQIHPTK